MVRANVGRVCRILAWGIRRARRGGSGLGSQGASRGLGAMGPREAGATLIRLAVGARFGPMEYQL